MSSNELAERTFSRDGLFDVPVRAGSGVSINFSPFRPSDLIGMRDSAANHLNVLLFIALLWILLLVEIFDPLTA
jgi:hypothetical protein